MGPLVGCFHLTIQSFKRDYSNWLMRLFESADATIRVVLRD